MSDAYIRTGRGGAGNFHAPKDIDDVATKEDTTIVEAQNSTAPSQPPPAGPGGYVRSGRGGAGNFVMAPSDTLPPATSSSSSSPSSPSNPTQDPNSVAVSVSVSVSAPARPAPTEPKHMGRGGAGNWIDAETTRRATEEQEQRRKEALDAGFAQEIRASLPQQPPRTYHLHAPGRGRRPEKDGLLDC
ncbi:hypothetical protein GGR50DRAFT_21109 [Xylaria sp. CBS 124048]|nr:hypothetical protein GGR50DRAFT_21109 [Xylaria sp. CBS 124048]